MSNPNKVTRGNKDGYQKVFQNKEKREEMLELARKGLSWSEIARMYGVNHTSIMYHCAKAGIRSPFRTQKPKDRSLLSSAFNNRENTPASHYVVTQLRSDIISLIVEEKMLVEDIADLYNVSLDTIVNYCKRNQINLEELYLRAKITTGAGYFSEGGFPKWRRDSIEGRICIGKSKAARTKELKIRERRIQKEKRKEILTY
jgi:transposase